ncbi:granzyme B-like [Sinocyclocheilus anshuiensis]|uniref:granzyme B-like n=1 Tax=Sinocyclocheilus anshuiensis TaxID=1608454 RepID=UPI0007BA6870|nr:PREDICTED: granzyme B-like [Sinocyclocheilus anshuiensis]
MIISVLLLVTLLPYLTAPASVQVGIVNGTEAKPHSRPYMVSVQSDNKHKCGGFLVSEQFVMTAAHCFKEGEKLTVVVGAHDYTHGSCHMDVKFYHIHPGYESKSLLNDIMLLQLHEKVNKSKNVNWISIPKKNKDIKTKVKCSVAGWGKKNTKGAASAKLMEVDVTIIDAKECKKYWGKNYSTSRMVCAGGRGGFCQGDSGGPLVCNNVAVGVVSFNELNNCNSPKLPNVYTKISKFLSWIKAILEAAHCARKAVLEKKVKTVKIPQLHYSVKSNTQCLVAGWGSTKQRKVVNDLLALNVSTVDIHNCKEAWKKYKESITKLPPNIICAGGYKQNGGVCLGDSGGPLVCNSMAVGIVSFSTKGYCGF